MKLLQVLIMGLILLGVSAPCLSKTTIKSISGKYMSSKSISGLAFKRCQAKLQTKSLRHRLTVEVVTVDPVKRRFMALCELSTLDYKKIAQLKRAL